MLPYKQKIIVGDVWILKDDIDTPYIRMDKVVIKEIDKRDHYLNAIIWYIGVDGKDGILNEISFRYYYRQFNVT